MKEKIDILSAQKRIDDALVRLLEFTTDRSEAWKALDVHMDIKLIVNSYMELVRKMNGEKGESESSSL